MTDNDTDLEKLRELTPLLKDFSYRALQTIGVEVESGTCIIHGVVILPDEVHANIVRVGGNAKIKRDHDGEHEYIICLQGSLTVTYGDGVQVLLEHYESHHVTPNTVGFSITGDNSRALIVTIPQRQEDK
jgi:hypothetical protein